MEIFKQVIIEVSETVQPLLFYCYLFCEFFILVATGSFSLESKWQQVSSALQDSSEYSSHF